MSNQDFTDKLGSGYHRCKITELNTVVEQKRSLVGAGLQREYDLALETNKEDVDIFLEESSRGDINRIMAM